MLLPSDTWKTTLQSDSPQWATWENSSAMQSDLETFRAMLFTRTVSIKTWLVDADLFIYTIVLATTANWLGITRGTKGDVIKRFDTMVIMYILSNSTLWCTLQCLHVSMG